MPKTKFHASGSNSAIRSNKGSGSRGFESSRKVREAPVAASESPILLPPPKVKELSSQNPADSSPWETTSMPNNSQNPANSTSPLEAEANSEQIPAIRLISREEAMALLNVGDEILFQVTIKQAGLDRTAKQYDADKIEAIAASQPRPSEKQISGNGSKKPEASLSKSTETEEKPAAKQRRKKGETLGKIIDARRDMAKGSFEELKEQFEAANVEQAIDVLEAGAIAFEQTLIKGIRAVHEERMSWIEELLEQSASAIEPEAAEEAEEELGKARSDAALRSPETVKRKVIAEEDFFNTLRKRSK